MTFDYHLWCQRRLQHLHIDTLAAKVWQVLSVVPRHQARLVHGMKSTTRPLHASVQLETNAWA